MQKTKVEYRKPAECAEEIGSDPAKVITWIHEGEITAVNIATRAGGKPRWRIAEDEWQRFLKARQSQPPAPPATRRKALPAGVKKYY